MEALIGVLIGCVIGNVVAITILVVEHRRWKKDKKLEHLRAEIRHKEEQYLSVLSRLEDCIKSEGDWNLYMAMRLRLVLRDEKNIVSVLQKMANRNISRQEMEKEYNKIVLSMEKSLTELDKKRNELML